jgi:acetyl esterase
MTALRWMSDHASELGVDATRLVIGGDSAGGNLAAVVAQHSPIELAGQMLIYPITDARMESQSYRENGEGYLLTTAMMEWFVHHYLAGTTATRTDPRVSPLRADRAILAETPPAFVLTAEFDPLRDEGEAYADALAAAGVTVESVRYEGQIHAFFSNPELLSDARAAVEDAAAWLRRIVA